MCEEEIMKKEEDAVPQAPADAKQTQFGQQAQNTATATATPMAG